ncbi:MAG: helix-hairpin-helix domain-containing protein [Pseudomonadota bacterium]
MLVPDILTRKLILFFRLKLFFNRNEVMRCDYLKPKEQQRDGRLTIILLLLFVFLSHQLLTRKNTLNLNIKYLNYTPEKLFYLRDEEKAAFLPELLPFCYYPFFFLPPPINSADKALLMTMKGVGPTLAESIIQYRQKAHVIANIDDLQKIPGIGGKRAVALANELTFDIAE